MRVCFYAPVKDKQVLDVNEFYAQDLRILRSIASQVSIATSPSDLSAPCDLYFVWWWTWAFLPLSVARARRVPSIITGTFDLENPIPGVGYYSRPPHQRALISWALRNASANVFVSEYEMKGVSSAIVTNRPMFAPHVVDASVYRFSNAPREDFLLTVGHLSQTSIVRKGIDVAVAAHGRMVKRGAATELWIAGMPGDGTTHLQELVRAHGAEGRVRFLGRISHEEKIGLMQRCGAYLQPSAFEGFGLAAAEAMACGAPVAAFRSGALPEVLGEGAHYAARRTVTDFVDAIERAVRSPDPEGRLKAAERIAERCSVARRREVIERAIEAAAAQGRGARAKVFAATNGGPEQQLDVLTYWRNLVQPTAAGDLSQVGHPDMGDEFNRRAYALRLRALERALSGASVDLPGARVFEAAYGTGFYLQYWKSKGCTEVFGADISEGACARAQINFPSFDLRVADLALLDKESDWTELRDRFTVVTAIDVLYHLVCDENAERALSSLAELVAPGGILVLTEKPQGLGEPRTEAPIVRRRPWSWYDRTLSKRDMLRESLLPVTWGMDPPSNFATRDMSYALARAEWLAMRVPLKSARYAPALQRPLGAALGSVGAALDGAILRAVADSPSLMMAVYRRADPQRAAS